MWRRFQFFHKEEIKIPRSEVECKQSFDVDQTCADSGRGYLVMGDSSGMVHCIRSGFRWSSFRAYQGLVSHVHHLQSRNTLVTVGSDGGDEARLVLKVWELEIPVESGEPPQPVAPTPLFKAAKATEKTAGGLPVVEVKAGDSKAAEEVTCLRSSEDLRFIAVGLSNGATVLFRGEIMGGDHRKFVRTKLSPLQSTAPVTGLFFQHIPGSRSVLFSISTNAVSTHRLADGVVDSGDESEVLDSARGAELGCCAQSMIGDVLVGREEAIFPYMYDGDICSPAGFFSFEGEKKQLMSFNGYLLVVGASCICKHAQFIV